ncbi:MAG: amidohydrolase family protein, partial [Gemmatimonadota bacterium]
HDVGIRIVLINTAYASGGVLQPLRAPQRRFNTPDLDEFLAQCDRLRDLVSGRPAASMAVAPHSIRAVPRAWLKPIHEWAERADVPVHMHVSEQTAEVDACVSAYGRRPVELLHDAGILDSRLTAIHATHIAVNEIALLARSRATVCACPSTERDLGDGFLQATSLHAAGASIAIGTDSQTVIDPFVEIRLIEYHERLRRKERVILGQPAGERAELAPTLLRYGTAAGARALQLDAGEIAEGKLADFVAIDLDSIQLAGWSDDSLAALLALSAAAAAVVTDTWVGGRKVAR